MGLLPSHSIYSAYLDSAWLLFVFVFEVLGIESKALRVVDKCSTT